jgi:hypothetical protein
VVLLAVPAAWGRTTVLSRFRAGVQDADAPITLLVDIDGKVAPDRAVQAVALREALMSASGRSRAAELLGLGRRGRPGRAGCGCGVRVGSRWS